MNSSRHKEIVDFIKQIYKGKEQIHLHEPIFIGNEIHYLKECIDTTFVSYMGPFVEKFEQALSQYTGAEFCTAVVNGTSALHLALIALDVHSSDEVITQGLTFVATANAIKYTGAEPVFLDINENNLGLDIKALKKFLNEHVEVKGSVPYNKKSGKKIAACVPVHVFGHSCAIHEIVDCCNEYNIPVVEDAAEALGSYVNNRHLGTIGKLGVFSFNGNKIVTTGGGGAIVSNDKELSEKIFHLSTTAKINHPWEYRHDMIGFNYRMPNVNAAIGVAQMEKLDQIIESKRNIAKSYKTFLESKGVKFVSEPLNSRSNYWLNAMMLDDLTERNEFLECSRNEKVYCRPVWELIPNLEMYQDNYRDDLSNALSVSQRLVNIPSSPVI